MPIPTAPFSSADIVNNYFSGGRRITQDVNWPSLADILQDIFDRIDMKNGRSSITGAATTVAVAFGTAYADNNYSVTGTAIESTVGFANVNVFITLKVAGGFTANISGAPGGANIVDVNWMAIHD